MMYVSGETAEPSPETTGMVEEIVRQQVIEMVSLAEMYQCVSAYLVDSSACVRSRPHVVGSNPSAQMT